MFNFICKRGIALSAMVGMGSGVAWAQDTDRTAPVYAAMHSMSGNPERFVGPRINMEVSDGVMNGSSAGGSFQARVGEDGAQGAGPQGPIDVRLNRLGQGFEVDGVWNGGNVHFLFDGRSISGNAVKQAAAGSAGLVSCHFYIGQDLVGGKYTGSEECIGYTEPLRFQVAPEIAARLSTPEGVMMFVAYLTSPLPEQYRR